MTKTIRLLFPQWQGGNNTDYYFGAKLLAHILPDNEAIPLIEVPVFTQTEELTVENGIEGEGQLLQQFEAAKTLLAETDPDCIITLGGDCSVSQAPFDYLNNRYGGAVGILWLDAHPDVATQAGSSRAHEMVLANLLGVGSGGLADIVTTPFKNQNIFFAGLIPESLRPIDQLVNTLDLDYASPQTLREDPTRIEKWIKENKLKQVVVHFDLDVLSPEDFRSIYPAEPYTQARDFPAAVGELTLKEVAAILTMVSTHSELVGLSITEHLPWDALRLRNALASLPLFSANS